MELVSLLKLVKCQIFFFFKLIGFWTSPVSLVNLWLVMPVQACTSLYKCPQEFCKFADDSHITTYICCTRWELRLRQRYSICVSQLSTAHTSVTEEDVLAAQLKYRLDLLDREPENIAESNKPYYQNKFSNPLLALKHDLSSLGWSLASNDGQNGTQKHFNHL